MRSRGSALSQKHPPQRTAILVLGMHRSGTSALARVLNLSGADLGRDLLAPKDDNELGFWENSAILALHEQLLARLGTTWHDIGIPSVWLDSQPAQRFEWELAKVLRQQFGDSRLILVKDPRLSLLVPSWLDVMRAQKVRPAFVIMVRDPGEVAASLGKRDGFSKAKSNLLWLQHMFEAERSTRGQARVFVHYERLLADWPRELKRIKEQLKLDLPPLRAEVRQQIEHFLRPQLRHHQHSTRAGGVQPHLLRKLLSVLESACKSAIPITADFKALDSQFDELMGVSAPVLNELANCLAQERRDHAKEIDQARHVIDSKDLEIARARVGFAQKDKQIEDARGQIDRLVGDIQQARAAFVQKDEEIEAARVQIEGLVSEIQQARAAFARKDEQIEAARQHIDELGGEIAKARAAHVARDEIEAQLRADLQRATELDALKERELATARRNIGELAGHIEQARAGFALKDEQIAAARRNIDELNEQIAQARAAHEERDEIEAQLRADLQRATELDALKEREIATARRNIDELADRVEQARRAHQARDQVEAGLHDEIDAARGNIDALANEIARARHAHDDRDITERHLREEIAALRASRWFRLGRVVGIMRPATGAPATPEPGPALLPSVALATPPGLHFAVESPLPGADIEGGLHVVGWCFAESGAAPVIRVRAGEHAANATCGTARTDVALAFPDHASAVDSGFEIRLNLPVGSNTVVVEVADAHAGWQALDSRTITVHAVALRASLDTPSPLVAPAGSVRFSGWCVHPQLRVMDLQITVGPAHAACQYRLGRADVAQAFPGFPGADQSGFEARVDVPSGIWPVKLVAVLEDASEAVFELAQPLRARAQPLHRRVARMASAGLGTLHVGFKYGRRWIADNRRLPRPSEIPQLLRLARELHRQSAGTDLSAALPAGFRVPAAQDSYAVWQECNRFNAAARDDLLVRLSALKETPLLSVVMPVYNPPLEHFAAAVESVRAQVYANWELCIADDASTAPGVHDYLQKLAADDARMRVCLRSENGNISLATNSAAELAQGEFIVLLDQDDLLTSDALGEIALAIAANPSADIVYSDDDKIGEGDRRFAPQFKPDWSPELLLAYMYFSHVFAMRRELYARVGGMRVGFEGSQDYDFALRASEQARAIAHVPQVLYHWRVLPGSTASSGAAKPASFEAGRRAVQDALIRRGVPGEAQQPEWARKAAVGIFGIAFPDDGPRVCIIIPTRNGVDILKRCIDSLRLTTYRNYEVLIVDNDSDDPATLAYLQDLPHRVERIGNPHGRFNYAYINNRAAERAQGDLLLFLNNDTEVVEPRWLSQMVGYAGFADVGAVGARLLYPDKRIQHAGIVHGYYRGLAGPAFKLTPGWDNGYLSYARVTRGYSAVTAACMVTPRKIFLELGGFDEVNFEVAYNDVDYCYRLGERGLRSVYCADAELLHHEGHSRGFLDRPQEVATFRRKYADKSDPYYSPHLSLDDERFAIKPRRFRPGSAAKVRALMCAFNLNWEGAPYSQLELTLGLRRGGFVEPIVYAPLDGPLRKTYEEAGIAVHVLKHPLDGVFDEAAYDQALDGFAAFIREQDVDLVYGNTLQTFYAIDAAQRAGLPTLWNPRESEPWQTYFNFLPAPLAARALRCFEYPYRVIFVAEATRKVFEPLDNRGNFTVIHNGLNLDRLHAEAQRFPRDMARRELGLAADDIAIVLPGTVCERKGQHDLARALAQLPADTASRTRTFVVGDRASSYSIELHKLVQALPVELRERVAVVPETNEIVRYYQAADIFVCTSRIESFPRVVLEAMVFDLPIVSTRVFGIAEQVGENVNALLYDPGDTARLARHLTNLAADNDLRKRFSANSEHVLATLNTFDEMVNAYGTIFREAALAGAQLLKRDST